MSTIIIIVLSIALVVSLFINWNLFTQVGILEEGIKGTGKIEQSALNVYEFFLKTFTHALNDMQRVDKNGAYSSDDEVGFAFRVIMDSIEQVKLQIEKIVDPEELKKLQDDRNKTENTKG